MTKNKRRNKDQKLRQSVEILKAQLNNGTRIEIRPNVFATIPKTQVSAAASIATKSSIEPQNKVLVTNQKMGLVEDSFIKKDLIKTIVLSIGAFAIIFTLWALNINISNFKI